MYTFGKISLQSLNLTRTEEHAEKSCKSSICKTGYLSWVENLSRMYKTLDPNPRTATLPQKRESEF